MVRSFWIGPPVIALALTASVWGQPVPSSPAPASRPGERIITLQEKDKPGQPCRLVRSWTKPDGMHVYQVQALQTGEMMTVVEHGQLALPGAPGRPAVRAVTTTIYHWGKANRPPAGAPLPPQGPIVQVSMPPSESTPARPLPPGPQTLPPMHPVPESHAHAPVAPGCETPGHQPHAEKLAPADLRVKKPLPPAPTQVTDVRYKKPKLFERIMGKMPWSHHEEVPAHVPSHIPHAEKLPAADLRVKNPPQAPTTVTDTRYTKPKLKERVRKKYPQEMVIEHHELSHIPHAEKLPAADLRVKNPPEAPTTVTDTRYTKPKRKERKGGQYPQEVIIEHGEAPHLPAAEKMPPADLRVNKPMPAAGRSDTGNKTWPAAHATTSSDRTTAGQSMIPASRSGTVYRPTLRERLLGGAWRLKPRSAPPPVQAAVRQPVAAVKPQEKGFPVAKPLVAAGTKAETKPQVKAVVEPARPVDPRQSWGKVEPLAPMPGAGSIQMTRKPKAVPPATRVETRPAPPVPATVKIEQLPPVPAAVKIEELPHARKVKKDPLADPEEYSRIPTPGVPTVEPPPPPAAPAPSATPERVAALPVKKEPAPPVKPVVAAVKKEPLTPVQPVVKKPEAVPPPPPAPPDIPTPPGPSASLDPVPPPPPATTPRSVEGSPPGTGSVQAAGDPRYVPVPIVTVPDPRRLSVPPAPQIPQAPVPNRAVNGGYRGPVNGSYPGPVSGGMANAFTNPGPDRTIPSETTPAESSSNAFSNGPQPAMLPPPPGYGQGYGPPMQPPPPGYGPPMPQGYGPPMPPQGVPGVARIPMMPTPFTPAVAYNYSMAGMPAGMPIPNAYAARMPNPMMSVPPTGYAQEPPPDVTPLTVVQMMQMLKDSDYPSQREWAADQLAGLNWRSHPEAVQSLVSAAKADPAPLVRACCVRSLARMQVNTVPVVSAVQGLKNDPDPRVRDAVSAALVAVGVGPQSGTGSRQVQPVSIPAPTGH
jgi:HEAT repeats